MTAEERHRTGVGETDIAIVGMAAHLPGAANIAAYRRNLRDGVSSIRRLTEDELREAGEDPGLMRHKNYVPFAAPLDDIFFILNQVVGADRVAVNASSSGGRGSRPHVPLWHQGSRMPAAAQTAR